MKATKRSSISILAGVALVALMVSLPAATEAKVRKRTVSATINGERVSWKGRLVIFDETPGHGFTAVATKIGGTKTIGFGCGVLLEGQPLPLTATMCNATYATRRGNRAETWLNTGLDPGNAFHVTFTSFDGSVVQGTLSGTLLSATVRDGSTLTMQGSFRGPLRR